MLIQCMKIALKDKIELCMFHKKYIFETNEEQEQRRISNFILLNFNFQFIFIMIVRIIISLTLDYICGYR